MGFEEGKFLEAAQEMDNIKLDGFEFFTESVKEFVQCKIYRKYEEVSEDISLPILSDWNITKLITWLLHLQCH